MEPSKQALIDHSVPEEHHEAILALEAPAAEAANLGITDVITLVKEFGPPAILIGRRIFELIRERRKTTTTG